MQIGQVSKEVAESIGLGKAQGALVSGVESGSPAEKAGLEPGDIIIRFDGKPIEKSSDLPRLVGNTRPGSQVAMTVFRRGASKQLNITVAELEPERTASARSQKPDERTVTPTGAAQHWGLAVGELSDSQKRELRIRGGVRIEAATEGAARAGLRAGDVILAVANQEVSSMRDFEAIVERADRARALNLLVRRGDVAQYVLIRPTR